jgi:RNA polymerase sigma factor (sigma-70 family)
VARNLAIDDVRRDRRIAALRASEAEAENQADAAPSADRILAAKERLRLLDEALMSLPPKPRQALLLHRVQGLSQAEIAAQLGVSESMVIKYVAQALRHCRDWRQRLEADE